MADIIRNLDDNRAGRILAAIARTRTGTADHNIELTSDLRQALAAEFCVGPATAPVSEGELARHTLLVLAEDPETRKAIESMAVQPESRLQTFDFGATSVVLAGAVMTVLQTHIHFERDKHGKWTLKLEKKSTSDTLLKGLVQKLVCFGK